MPKQKQAPAWSSPASQLFQFGILRFFFPPHRCSHRPEAARLCNSLVHPRGSPANQGPGGLSSAPPSLSSVLWSVRVLQAPMHRHGTCHCPTCAYFGAAPCQRSHNKTLPRSRLAWCRDLSRQEKRALAGRASPRHGAAPSPDQTGPARPAGGPQEVRHRPGPPALAVPPAVAVPPAPGPPWILIPGSHVPAVTKPGLTGDTHTHTPAPAGGRDRAAAPARSPPSPSAPSRREEAASGRSEPRHLPSPPGSGTRRARERPRRAARAPLPPPRLGAAATHRVEQVEGAEAVLGAGEAPAHHRAAAAAGEPRSRRPRPPRPAPRRPPANGRGRSR